MEISNYISSLSMAMSNTQLNQSLNIGVLKKAMDTQDTELQAIADMMQVVPSFGHQMDIRV